MNGYSPRIARYKKKLWRRWRAVGACGRCGKPTNINKLTNEPYSECFKHRIKTAKRKRLSMRKKRNEQRIHTLTSSNERNK